jgi:hypothetical protein
VFALGFQSLNVNGGHYLLAFLTSFAISGSNLVLFKLAPGATFGQCVAFMGGGPFGIVAAMWVHSRYVRRGRREDQASDPWEEVLRARLAGVKKVTLAEVLQVHLNIQPGRMSVNDARRVARILLQNGWLRTRPHAGGPWVWTKEQAS